MFVLMRRVIPGRGRRPRAPESISTASGYGFRPSPLSRLGRNDELKGLSPSNTSSFPRRVFCARVLFLASLTRNEGWAEHRETYGRSCEAPVRRVRTRQALVRRLASHVRGTLASRRSTVAILGPGPRFPHRTCVQIGHSELLASGS